MSDTNEILQAGQEGDAVLDLQGRLQFLGYYEGRIDGSFGEYTQQAVYEYQQAMGQTPSGAVEPEALEYLRQETDQYQYDAVAAQSGGYAANVEARRQQVADSYGTDSYGAADTGVETNAEGAQWQEHAEPAAEAEYQAWSDPGLDGTSNVAVEQSAATGTAEPKKGERAVNDDLDYPETEEAEAPVLDIDFDEDEADEGASA
jgi:peptidoglycan hydrolase-like protein with peptidoglycan-binding domain